MAELDKGMRARVRPAVIAGEIVGKRFDPDTGEKELKLAWTSDGEPHERWFKPDELQADEPGAEAN